jgi:thiol-disulfide isomerase/thioredoxin
MKKRIYLLIILLTVISAQSPQIINDSKKDNPMLIGLSQRSDYEHSEHFKQWFNEEYESYEIDEETLYLTSAIEDEIKIECFMGTWCEDSRREVPRFYKILDQIKFNEKNLKIVSVDRGKVSPGGEEKGKNIHHVPTMIFYSQGQELGRIIEYPVGTLEEDVVDIMFGNPPTPNYADWQPGEEEEN